MSTDGESYFRCPECEARRRTVAVDYDRLGYPVCPNCGAGTGPLADAHRPHAPVRWRGRAVRRRTR